MSWLFSQALVAEYSERCEPITLAHSDSPRELQQGRGEPAERRRTGYGSQGVAVAERPRLEGFWFQPRESKEPEPWNDGSAELGCWWKSEPDVGRVAHGVAHRVDRLKALGNGQVSAVAESAWEMLAP